MNTKQYAQKVLTLNFEYENNQSNRNISVLSEELFEGTVKKFYEGYNPDRKAEPEIIQQVHDALNKINQKIDENSLVIAPSEKIHKFCYKISGHLFYAFLQKDSIIIAKHIRTNYVFRNIFSLKDGIISNYTPEQFNATSPHDKMDMLLKLKNTQPYEKSNHLIYAIKKLMHIDNYHYNDSDDAFLHYALAKIHATILLDEVNPEKLILDDIVKTKNVIIHKMEKYHPEKTNELNELIYCVNKSLS